MRAATFDRFGPPSELYVGERERPSPAPDQALVRVEAAGVNPLEWRLVRGKPYVLRFRTGLLRPQSPTLGFDVAGVVEELGSKAGGLAVGDRVFGYSWGSFAEYVAARADHLVKIPEGTSFVDAAGVPASATTALQCLRDFGRLREGGNVLINGASGGVGTFAVQLAKSFGATVCGVCSGRNVELVRSLGADRVLDYERDDLRSLDAAFDLVLDIVGNHTVGTFQRLRAPGGLYVAAAWTPARLLWLGLPGRRRSRSMIGKPRAQDLQQLAKTIERGELRTVVDRTYSLEDVGQAVAHVESSRARGKIIVVP
ncbi:MAG: NAD(P)-dependent alcohol dehydrogenase [Acidobacteriota bacterium]